MPIYRVLPMLLAGAIACPALAGDGGGVSSPVISRCAGKAGLDTRQSDAAFGLLALDGVPWLAIERTEEAVGSQPITTTVTGTGARHRRNGTSVPFRFTCVLDARGQALMFHASHLMPKLGDTLPPATIVAGSASYLEKMVLPHGVELRIQLLDVARLPAGEVLAEQVVRSGWQVPIPFALRLPADISLQERTLVLSGEMVLARQALFRLKNPRSLAAADLRKPIDLTLERVESSRH